MRRKQQEIADKTDIENLLKNIRVGRLATIGEDGFPYITPLNYVYYSDAIYFHCALKGQKLDNIRLNDKVGFEIDIPIAYLDTAFDTTMPPCEVGQFYQSVVIRGRAEIIVKMDEKVAALNALMASHEGVESYTGIKAESKAVALCAVVAVRIESMSGKANLAQKKSDADKKKLSSYFIQRGLPGDREAAVLIYGK